MPKPSTRKTGSHAEAIAAQYLQQQQYTVLFQNWHAGALGELDIICSQNNTLVIVEVKSSRNSLEDAMAQVTPAKQAQCRHLAQAFLQKNPNWLPHPLRFDVIAIWLRPQKNLETPAPALLHLKAVF